MALRIGNAPCSWGVEFAQDPRNPSWESVLDQAREAGYSGIELGPVGFMPEDPARLADALAARALSLIGGGVFRPFHDPAAWEDVRDGAVRTCRALASHGAEHLVLIDSISPRRAPTAGRPDEAEQLSPDAWAAYVERIRTIARMGTEEYGLTVGIHAHAGGFCDFRPELERLLEEIDADILKICLDTGHSVYAGFDPVAFYRSYADRVSYLHFKDIDPAVKARVVAERTDFYTACGAHIFCKLGRGAVDFAALKAALDDHGFRGWATVEQDIDPLLDNAPLADARDNLNYLRRLGLAA